jgi:predicted TIM-barrel fold metal-dependent hydrolase
MEKCGIDQAALCPNKPRDYDLLAATHFVAQTVRQHPDRFFGFARVDPWQGQGAAEHLKWAYETWGVHGLLLHPWEETFRIADSILDPLIDYAADHGLLVLAEIGYPWLAHVWDVAELAKRHPSANIVGTHGLQLDSSAYALVDVELAMRECGNLLLETSGMYAGEFMEKLVQELGAHRLIFGSHTPWLNLELELARIQHLDLTPEQRQAILYTNAANMFMSAD